MNYKKNGFKIVPKIITICVFLSFLFNNHISGAETLNYKGVIKDALDTSARLRMKSEEVNVAQASYRQAFAEFYPSISANSRIERYENLNKSNQEISTIYGEVVGGNQSSWRSMLYLSGQYDLSLWYKKRFDVAYYKKLIDVSVSDCEIETKRLLLEITDIFNRLTESKIKLKHIAKI